MSNSKLVPQHKQIAMGDKVNGMKKGGLVKGLPGNAVTTAKRNNDIPAFKKGGMVKGKKC